MAEDNSIKCVVVGDRDTGKSALIEAYVNNRDEENFHLIFNAQSVIEKSTKLDTKSNHVLHIWELGGETDPNFRERVGYPKADVVIIAFSKTNPDSFESIKDKWAPEVHENLPGVPIVVVGTKIDEIINEATQTEDESIIPSAQGRNEALGNIVKGDEYVECSAKTSQGIGKIFSEAAELVLERRKIFTKKEEKRINEETRKLSKLSNKNKTSMILTGTIDSALKTVVEISDTVDEAKHETFLCFGNDDDCFKYLEKEYNEVAEKMEFFYNETGQNLLHIIVQRQFLTSLKYILEQHPNDSRRMISEMDINHRTPLMVASKKNGFYDIIETFMKNNEISILTGKDNKGLDTHLLLWYAHYKFDSLAKMILSKADTNELKELLNETDGDDNTILMKTESESLAMYIINNYADHIDMKASNNKEKNIAHIFARQGFNVTALLSKLEAHSDDTFEILIQSDWHGNTPLMASAIYSNGNALLSFLTFYTNQKQETHKDEIEEMLHIKNNREQTLLFLVFQRKLDLQNQYGMIKELEKYVHAGEDPIKAKQDYLRCLRNHQISKMELKDIKGMDEANAEVSKVWTWLIVSFGAFWFPLITYCTDISTDSLLTKDYYQQWRERCFNKFQQNKTFLGQPWWDSCFPFQGVWRENVTNANTTELATTYENATEYIANFGNAIFGNATEYIANFGNATYENTINHMANLGYSIYENATDHAANLGNAINENDTCNLNTHLLTGYPNCLEPVYKFSYSCIFMVLPWVFYLHEYTNSEVFRKLMAVWRLQGNLAWKNLSDGGIVQSIKPYLLAITAAILIPLVFITWPVCTKFIHFYYIAKYRTSTGREKVRLENKMWDSALSAARAHILEVCTEASFEPLLQWYQLFPKFLTWCLHLKEKDIDFKKYVENVGTLKLVFSLLSSLFSLGWSFSVYKVAQKRGTLDLGENLAGRIVLFLSNLFLVVARLQAFIMFTYYFGPGKFFPSLLFIAGHVILISALHGVFSEVKGIWEREKKRAVMICLINGLANIFLHNNIGIDDIKKTDEVTRWKPTFARQLAFDVIFLVENAILSAVGALNATEPLNMVRGPFQARFYVVAAIFSCHLLGLFFKYVYYKKLHTWSFLTESAKINNHHVDMEFKYFLLDEKKTCTITFPYLCFIPNKMKDGFNIFKMQLKRNLRRQEDATIYNYSWASGIIVGILSSPLYVFLAILAVVILIFLAVFIITGIPLFLIGKLIFTCCLTKMTVKKVSVKSSPPQALNGNATMAKDDQEIGEENENSMEEMENSTSAAVVKDEESESLLTSNQTAAESNI